MKSKHPYIPNSMPVLKDTVLKNAVEREFQRIATGTNELSRRVDDVINVIDILHAYPTPWQYATINTDGHTGRVAARWSDEMMLEVVFSLHFSTSNASATNNNHLAVMTLPPHLLFNTGTWSLSALPVWESGDKPEVHLSMSIENNTIKVYRITTPYSACTLGGSVKLMVNHS